MRSRRPRIGSGATQEAQAMGGTTQHLRRISNLLALLVVKGENQTQKILTLTAAGFGASELSELLGTTPNTIAVTVYQARRKRPTPAKRRESA